MLALPRHSRRRQRRSRERRLASRGRARAEHHRQPAAAAAVRRHFHHRVAVGRRLSGLGVPQQQQQRALPLGRGPGTACCAQTARAAAAACLCCHGIHAAAEGAHGNDVLLPEGVRGLSNIASTSGGSRRASPLPPPRGCWAAFERAYERPRFATAAGIRQRAPPLVRHWHGRRRTAWRVAQGGRRVGSTTALPSGRGLLAAWPSGSGSGNALSRRFWHWYSCRLAVSRAAQGDVRVGSAAALPVERGLLAAWPSRSSSMERH